MIRKLAWSILFPALFLSSLACSTKKRGILNIGYNTINAKYNVLFNGKEALAIGETILAQAFDDNFYEILPIEPLNLRGENFDETTLVPGFNRAEEKAVKTIQKYSMRIDEVQYNNQIEQAYLLLGKARYFDRRFFPALEAFNYLLKSGAKRSVFVEGKIWREKTNIRLKNYELAIDNLRPLVQSLPSNNAFYPLANATLAEAFLQLEALDSARYYIKKAAVKEPKKKNKARYLFITGQLFEQQQKYDSARWAYQEIENLKRKAPRKFTVQAKIKKAFLASEELAESRELQLKRMLNNYENIPFEHQIYSALGALYLKEGQDSLALVAFDQSNQAPQLDIYTEIQNYTSLYTYYFSQGDYVKTGDYLDKVLPLFEEQSVLYKKTKRQRDNLADVILYEKRANETDSILAVLKLSVAEQRSFYERFIEDQQRRSSEELKKQIETKQFIQTGRGKSSFYFYNSNLLLQGRQSYLSQWGNRPNVDNWRSASELQSAQVEISQKSENIQILPEAFSNNPDQYIDLLPKTESEIDSIRALNQKAYLQLGLIYKEKFSNFDLAQQKLSQLLTKNPPEELAVQALYHLFLLAEKQELNRAEDYKKELIENYPESAFAQLLSDPENFSATGIVTPERLYENVLSLYNNNSFVEVLEKVAPLKVLTSGSSIEPKLALLKAHTVGRLYGVESWKEALNEVVDKFGEIEEGKTAKNLLLQIEATGELQEQGPIYKNYKWVFVFQREQWNPIDPSVLIFQKQIKETRAQWNISVDPYNEKFVFVVVHGILDPNEIEQWLEENKTNPLTVLTNENFVALASQYRTYLKTKSWKSTK